MARPVYVTIAVALFFAGLVIDIVRWVPKIGEMIRGEASMLAVVAPAVGFLVGTWLFLRVYAGRNWARITVLVIYLVVIAGITLRWWSFIETMHDSVKYLVDWPAAVSTLARPVLNTIALVLVFGPGRGWFAPR